ncbi:hypothetical protein D6D11_07807 [Aureobasidium pullulans]|nr:hypothetical protein D6D11_07807 [Aureobasidium pullulans]
MILDGLSVPAELVRDIIVDDRFNVKILSIRKVTNMNQRGLQLKGLYLFGHKDAAATPSSRDTSMSSGRISAGVMSSEGAQIGAEWNARSEVALSAALLGHDQPLEEWWRTRGNIHPRPIGPTYYSHAKVL